MRPIVFKLFLPLLFIALACLCAKGQTCTGSLGDPVINETFGAGTAAGIGPALPYTTTTYNYVANSCPEDGSYTISTTSGPSSCFGVWQVTTDHTGDPNGYMMVVNASLQPSIFYTNTVKGGTLCPNTTYEFAAWIANLITSSSGNNFIKPNITFTITTTDGRALAPAYNTGDVPEEAAGSANLWHHYGTYFTTPNDGSDIVVTMTNNAPGGSGNDLLLDDITFRPCGPVIKNGIGSVAGSTSQTICQGDNTPITLNASQTGYASPQYQWQLNKDTTGWADIPGATTNVLVLSNPGASAGSYQYRMGVLGGASTSLACRIYSSPINITVNPLPVLTIATSPSACEGGSIVLMASGGASYQWSGPGLAPTSQNPLVINNITTANAGKYTVVATSAQNCSTSGSVNITVYPKVTAVVSGDATICQGGAVALIASGGSFYSWTPTKGLSDSTAASIIASPQDSTKYTVRVSNADGCSDTISVRVNVLLAPVANAGNKKIIFEGASTQLNGSAKGSVSGIYWTPTTGLSDPTSLTPIASPLYNTTYTLHVLSGDNCGIDSSSVFVRVYRKVIIPNAFSPNNDYINDLWEITDLNTYPDCLVLVFNRYGQQVYKSVGYNSPWDGTFNGHILPTGTYYYIIDLKNDIPKLSGWVVIVR